MLMLLEQHPHLTGRREATMDQAPFRRAIRNGTGGWE